MRAIRSMIEAIVYPDRLGRIIANINSIEVEIRVFLLIEQYGIKKANLWAESLHTLKVWTRGRSESIH